MTPRCVTRLHLQVALLVASAAVLSAQESTVTLPVGTRPPDAAANAIMPNMSIPTTAGEPFSGTSVALLTQTREGSSVRFGFISLVARDSSGRMYYENRRPLAPSGEPLPRTYFMMFDPGLHTRTMCYVATKTCRIDALPHATYDESGNNEEAPHATTTKSTNLGAREIESLTVVGTRETTVIAAGAYGNRQPIVTTKEVWHSSDLDLDVSIIRTDPRWGTQSRTITGISRGEPDAEYFTIPADYKRLDNRPPATK